VRSRGLNVLVTSGTVTSAGIAEKRLPPDVIHQFAPVDLPQFAARFLDHWKPDLALFVESDLWPAMIMGGVRAQRATDPDQRTAVGAVIPSLAHGAAHHRRAVAAIRSCALAQSGG
jgi:hypothetical protein